LEKTIKGNRSFVTKKKRKRRSALWEEGYIVATKPPIWKKNWGETKERNTGERSRRFTQKLYGYKMRGGLT